MDGAEVPADAGMQAIVRSTILRLVDQTPGVVDRVVVREHCPGAGTGDMEHAVDLLLREGMLELPSWATTPARSVGSTSPSSAEPT
jgi:hypothetical protein